MARRRSHGDGTVYQLPSGRYRAQVGLPNGKRLGKTFRKEADAERWRRRTAADVESGKNTATPTRETLAAFLTRWLPLVSLSLRPGSERVYRNHIERHLVPALGFYRLSDLRSDHIASALADQAQAGLAPSTVRQSYGILHRALEDAVRWKLLDSNPCNNVTAPKRPKRPRRAWTLGEVQAFLLLAQTHRMYALFLSAITTGLRVGELVGLTWADVDLEAGRVQVRLQLQRVKGKGLVPSEAKTDAGQRQVSLPGLTVEALRRWRERQQFERWERGESWRSGEWVFTTRTGGPMEQSTAYQQFTRLTKAIGLPEITFHDLRHTAASLYLKGNVAPKVVQGILGHSDIRMTIELYSHLMPGMDAEAARVMERLLEK